VTLERADLVRRLTFVRDPRKAPIVLSPEEVAHLLEAVAAYREALQVNTRGRLPLDWAMTQNNLGNALLALGERESGTARLEEAVSAYREALQERIRERVPFDWAGAQMNLGSALLRLSERESGTARLGRPLPPFAKPCRN
jgi:tetratricopeptide (TPR) repeat protein